jgi:lipid II:glycine glycyltransferase (peptidoglycan interpeptide bridge formation enzyme)
MEEYRLVRKIDRKEWSEFVLNHPQGNVFQSPETFDLFQGTNNYEPVFLAAVNKSMNAAGVLQAVIQKESKGIPGYFSSRTIIFGGPLIKVNDLTDRLVILEKLLSGLIKIVKFKSIYIQFRNFFDVKSYEVVFKKFDFKYLEHLNYIVGTSSRLETEKRISRSKRRQVRKSLQSGAKILESVELEQVKNFYHILKNLYRTKVRRPLPDWSFFKTFYQMSRKEKIGKYFLVEYNKEIIGGIMCPITRGKTIYEWYICGLDGRYKGVYPSVLATWAPIDYALKNGLKYFDFMGAGKPDQDYSVREFKSKFGGKRVKYGRFERINNKPLYIAGRFGLKILGALKK